MKINIEQKTKEIIYNIIKSHNAKNLNIKNEMKLKELDFDSIDYVQLFAMFENEFEILLNYEDYTFIDNMTVKEIIIFLDKYIKESMQSKG